MGRMPPIWNIVIQKGSMFKSTGLIFIVSICSLLATNVDQLRKNISTYRDDFYLLVPTYFLVTTNNIQSLW